MASLQVLRFNGAYAGRGIPLQIPDGPPVAAKVIDSGDSDTVFGAAGDPVICDLCPIGGDVMITWPGDVVEVLTGPATRALRGETVSVA